MSAGIVGDDGMRHAMSTELKRGERGALIARPRLVHPDMDRDAGIVRAVDGRERRAPIDTSKPAGVAMGEDIDARALLLFGMRFDDAKSALTDLAAGFHIRIADLGGTGVSRGDARLARLVAQGGAHLIERPAEIDSGRTRGEQTVIGAVERLVG